MTPTNPFPAVLALLKRAGWGKGQSVSATGALCLGEATNVVCGQYQYDGLSIWPVLASAITAAGFVSPHRACCAATSIPDFNDAPERTWEDIVLVLKHAERLLDERYPTPAGG